ncbi:peptidoglycan-binding domain-containing protein [Thiomicrorhabdus xiamenensis]|uniref:Peptidoglycan binding-like domain-containing protein n=1 Tax=Thiomicrorhabdus xiamenensis TaxID=2739063 RepID=A0A7D4P4S4_9GAMM|nr:peptidoglycan-binding domain-containing protein [Thiomicrorhabdus xiamenensis]QKI89115.1 hypothetical protein HQN79_05790 [Thiomicrorhabdus xiamenensis]
MKLFKLTVLSLTIAGLFGCVPSDQVQQDDEKKEVVSPADIDLLIAKAKAEERERILAEQSRQKKQAEVFALLKKQQAQPEAMTIDDSSIAGNIDGRVYKACMAELTIPAQYRIDKERILVEPESTHQEFEPAEYKTVEKRIEIEPEQKVVDKVVPAKYKTVTEEVVVTPARERWVSVPAEYEIRDVRIKVKDGYEEWQPCFKTSPGATLKDGEYRCLVKVADEYKTVKQKKLVKAKSVTKELIPAETKKVQRKVLVEPEKVVYKTIPAKYKTVTSKELIAKPKTMQVTSAAKYETVEKRVKIEEARTETRKVVCKAERSEELVKRIQIVLEKEGYLKPSPPNDLDVIDGLWGPNTAKTLSRYQRDNNLAEGAITFEVLHFMGIMK